MSSKERSARLPPHNMHAEESALGAALLTAEALEVVCTEMDPIDFYRPRHQAIVWAMDRLYRSGNVKVDPVIVAAEMGAADLEMVGGLAGLLSLQVNTPSTSNIRAYCKIIRDMATLRDLVASAERISELGYESVDAGIAMDQAREIMGSIDMPTGDNTPSMAIEDFMQIPVTYDWVVPGLIERGDRTMITGGEGEGKSTLLRQMMVSIAAGMHPFDYYPFEMTTDRGTGKMPTVMLMDAENSENQIRRKMLPLLQIEGVQRRYEHGHLRLEVRPEGIDLTKRHDTTWLMERVAANKPDLLVIGPIYKLYDGDPNKEELVRKVIHVLDLIRVRYGCALLIEAHSPHGEPGKGQRDPRPLGSSMWRRWPEFGYGLVPSLKDEDELDHPMWFRAWRGSRDERDWPAKLVRASPWPWGVPREVGAPVHRGDAGYTREPDADYQSEDF